MKRKVNMGTIYIRNVDERIIVRLDRLAEKAGLSRNAYMKKYIENMTVLEELKNSEDRYTTLVNTMAEIIAHNSEEMRRLTSVVQKLQKKLGDDYE